MENLKTILNELSKLGTPSVKAIHLKHGAKGELYGVKIGDMKPIVKRIRKNYELANALYDTGNSDAMYLAGLIGDETKMTKADLQRWAEQSTWHMISEYTVPFVAAESPYGWEMALQWIESGTEKIAASGWATLSSICSIYVDEDLDLKQLQKLLLKVEKEIHQSPDRVRSTMNQFVVSVGTYVETLYDKAFETAKKVGPVEIFTGDTACKITLATSALLKVKEAGRVGKKRKTARC